MRPVGRMLHQHTLNPFPVCFSSVGRMLHQNTLNPFLVCFSPVGRMLHQHTLNPFPVYFSAVRSSNTQSLLPVCFSKDSPPHYIKPSVVVTLAKQLSEKKLDLLGVERRAGGLAKQRPQIQTR